MNPTLFEAMFEINVAIVMVAVTVVIRVVSKKRGGCLGHAHDAHDAHDDACRRGPRECYAR